MNKPTKYKGILFVTNYTDTYKKKKKTQKQVTFYCLLKR